MRACLTLLGLLSVCSFSLEQECKQDLLTDVDFPGSDITYVHSPDAKHCQRLCTQHSGCHHFTFVRPDWTQDNRHFYCYLKFKYVQPISVQKVGVTSGYSLKPCCSQPKCLSLVYQDVDFPGADYRSLFTADYATCQRLCTQDPTCQFFTFINAAFERANIRYKCHLKYSWVIPRTPIVEATAGVTSGFSDKVQMSQSSNTVCKSLLFSNTDIPGNNIEELATGTPQHCQALCSAHPRCTFFSFDSKALKCFLKSNTQVMVTAPADKIISGLPARFCEQSNDWVRVALQGVDFRGTDIRYELMDDPQACQEACNKDSTCQFYTYVDSAFRDRHYWRRCYLKSVISIPAPPAVAKLANAVSGFSLRDCA